MLLCVIVMELFDEEFLWIRIVIVEDIGLVYELMLVW